jgi:DNA-binding LacI/PurR family transcriptional regulator
MSLKKIAEMTGASVSTVSRVLNNNSPTCASKELKDKIWRAAHEINYIPNQNACSLKSGEKQKGAYQVAVVLARISNLDDDPFFREVFRSLETELFSKNILLSAVVCAEAPPDFNISKADGIIILGRCSEKLLSYQSCTIAPYWI